MGAVWMRVRADLRNRARASIGLVLLIGIAGGLVVAAAAGARRTSSAYPAFRKAQNTAQTAIANAVGGFGFATVDFDRAEKLPAVVDSARFSFFVSFVKTPEGKELTPIGDENPVVLFASADGRFDRALDRMLILEGRISDPAADDEVVASYIAATSYDLRIGDTLQAQFPSFTDFSGGPAPTKLTGPLVRLKIVGIEATSVELQPGLGYPPLHLTPAFYRRYRDQTPHFDALKMKLRSDSDFGALADGLQRAIVAQPGGTASNRIQQFDEVSNARAITRSVRVQTTALWLLAAIAGTASLLILAQAISRESFIQTEDHPTLKALGLTTDELFASAALRMLVVGVGAAIVAVAVALAVSPAFPIGLPRLVDLHPGVSVDVVAFALGAAGIVLFVGGFGAWSSARAARQSYTARDAFSSERTSRIAGALAKRSFPPASVVGVRLALEPGRGRTATPVRSTLFGTTTALIALVTALGFGASIDRLLSTPRLVGWNWSGAVGDDFDPDDAARVLPVLQADHDVAEYSGGGSGDIQIAGASVPILAQDPVVGTIGPLLLEGRTPRAADEIALGARTLRRIHARVGDRVTARLGAEARELKIVGRAVISPLVNDTTTGVGGWMTFQGLRRFGPGISEDIFVFRFAEGVDAKSALARLKQRIPDLAIASIGAEGEVGNLRRVSALPVALAGILTLIAVATLGHTIMSVVRRRGRDFAILKTLGFGRTQVRATVAWQASSMIVITLIVGLPAGIAAGRWLWTVFANQLGVVAEPVVLSQVFLTIPAALILANVIAWVAARAVARTRPALVLRSE
jgi:hypothetical protein